MIEMTDDPSQALSDIKPPAARRVGFWVGLVIFVGLLLSPPPESMRRAVKTHFASEIERQFGDGAPSSDAGERAATVGSAESQQAKARAIDRRARLMMTAAAVCALVACWWMTEAIPIPATSILPLLLFPLLGVMPMGSAAAPYANKNIFLFMGGFLIALAIERWGLHRRIALNIVRVAGTGRSNIVLGFMVASAALSMWISNTATTLMMVPIALAITSSLESFGTRDRRSQGNFAAAIMLGIAYAASVGGVATPIGTPPNIAFYGQTAKLFPEASEISFAQWTFTFAPLVVVFVPVIWLVLTRVTCRVDSTPLPMGREVIRHELRQLGSMRRPEVMVLNVFLLTALLWMTRSIPMGGDDYGWSGLLARVFDGKHGFFTFRPDYIDDATVALGMAIPLFFIRAGRNDRGGHEFLLDWKTAEKLPWGILLLFGGGFSIAAGFQASGLSAWCGTVFADLPLTSPLARVIGVCLLLTFLTEITSNTATTLVMLPILAEAAPSMGIHPFALMIPATISASCAFMLPVATPPNAIVFGSGHVEMGRMVRTGLILNFTGVVLVTGTFYFLARTVMNIDIMHIPDWVG